MAKMLSKKPTQLRKFQVLTLLVVVALLIGLVLGWIGNIRANINDPRIWLSLAAFAFSLTSFGFLFVERRLQRRTDVTLSLYTQWTNQEMYKCRARVWEKLESTATSKMRWSVLQPSEVGHDFCTMDHFIADVNTLTDAELLNKSLAQKLFATTLCKYIRRLQATIEYDTAESHSYFHANVLPLLTKYG